MTFSIQPPDIGEVPAQQLGEQHQALVEVLRDEYEVELGVELPDLVRHQLRLLHVHVVHAQVPQLLVLPDDSAGFSRNL